MSLFAPMVAFDAEMMVSDDRIFAQHAFEKREVSGMREWISVVEL
ncbi:hypothetical protein [Tumebacillus lipolyticus]|uniref:Uncharacterized protein n=1 Tax=Tumebacillus lipolyticus TaxID=1280370 RepID=A0ABW5A1E8_9BACL